MRNEPLLDMQVIDELREMLGEDLSEIFSEYVTDSERLLGTMELAAAQNDVATLTPLAHTLKGSSGNLGIALIYNLAKELETAGRTGTIADPVGAVAQLKVAFAATQDALRGLAGEV